MMKKILFLFVILHLTLCIEAQKVIPLEKEGGVYKLSCKVNGAKMKMIFDTGASTVSLSMAIANYLYENDYIKKDDIVGKGKSQTADGSIVNHIVINLRDIEISGLHIKNVEATVIDGQNAPLLLGQSALKQLGSYTINGSSMVLNDVKESLSDEELEGLEEAINESMGNRQYYSAIDNLRKIEAALGLSVNGYINLTSCFFSVKQYEDAVEAGKRGLRVDNILDDEKELLLDYISTSYYFLNDYQNCIKYNEVYAQNTNDLKKQFSIFFQIGDCYHNIGNRILSEMNFIKAINRIMQYRKISVYDICEGNVFDDDLGMCFYSLAVEFLDDYNNKGVTYAEMGAMCNNKGCISICEKKGYDYKKNGKKMIKMFKDSGLINKMKESYILGPE